MSTHVYVICDIILFYFMFTFYSSNIPKIYRTRLYSQELSSRSPTITLSALLHRSLIPSDRQKTAHRKCYGRGFKLANALKLPRVSLNKSNNSALVMRNIRKQVFLSQFPSKRISFHVKVQISNIEHIFLNVISIKIHELSLKIARDFILN